MKKSSENMQKKLDLAIEAMEEKNQPPGGLEAINDRKKLEDRAVYNSEKWSSIAPQLPEAMNAYKNCEKTNLGTGIVMATGTLGVYQDVSSHVSMVPGPAATGYIIQETAKAFDKALNHVEDHNRECAIQKTLSQPDPTAYSHKLLCENTQKQAAMNPFTADVGQTTVLPVQIPALSATLADNPFGNHAPAIMNRFMPLEPDVTIRLAASFDQTEIQILGLSSPQITEDTPNGASDEKKCLNYEQKLYDEMNRIRSERDSCHEAESGALTDITKIMKHMIENDSESIPLFARKPGMKEILKPSIVEKPKYVPKPYPVTGSLEYMEAKQQGDKKKIDSINKKYQKSLNEWETYKKLLGQYEKYIKHEKKCVVNPPASPTLLDQIFGRVQARNSTRQVNAMIIESFDQKLERTKPRFK